MAETRAGLARKAGPLPLWAWGILGGIAVYFLYVRYHNASANSAANSPVATTLDPNAVDPTTGLTYGQELAGSYPTSGGVQAAADGATNGGNGLSPTDALDQQLASFLQAQADFSQVAGALGYTPPNPSAATTAAAASPPVQNTSPPTPNPTPANRFAAQDKPLLAPGVAAAPNYALTPPKNAPTQARWAGPHSPGPNWVGIGGGWWAPKQDVHPTKPPAKPAAKKK